LGKKRRNGFSGWGKLAEKNEKLVSPHMFPGGGRGMITTRGTKVGKLKSGTKTKITTAQKEKLQKKKSRIPYK